MIELHLDSVIFTFTIIIVGIAYGYFCYFSGIKSGQDDLINDLINQGIIELDENGDIISRG